MVFSESRRSYRAWTRGGEIGLAAGARPLAAVARKGSSQPSREPSAVGAIDCNRLSCRRTKNCMACPFEEQNIVHQKESFASLKWRGPVMAGALALLCASFASAARASCEDLAKFPVTDGKITSVVTVAEKSAIPLNLIPPVDDRADGFLPRCRHSHSFQRLRHHGGGLAAGCREMERKILRQRHGGFGGTVSGRHSTCAWRWQKATRRPEMISAMKSLPRSRTDAGLSVIPRR